MFAILSCLMVGTPVPDEYLSGTFFKKLEQSKNLSPVPTESLSGNDLKKLDHLKISSNIPPPPQILKKKPEAKIDTQKTSDIDNLLEALVRVPNKKFEPGKGNKIKKNKKKDLVTCNTCGAIVDAKFKFCNKCGNLIK